MIGMFYRSSHMSEKTSKVFLALLVIQLKKTN